MSMHFEDSSSVTLLFDFWDVHGPAGMALSVFVVLLLTVLYELLKVWKITLGEQSQDTSATLQHPFSPPPPCFSSTLQCQGSSPVLSNSPSETSLTPTDNTTITTTVTTTTAKSWFLHCLQTAIHIVQVTLGYMLMLCVMSYNVWIFVGVIVGSVIGYFLAFPLLGKVC
ncbi:protein SLC31A2 [Chanos chanos]|uniref:Copper transport protein n=1 Tax=Chanos chanos TaxID=29144 RepID=A0A6J2V2N0_CHACN|nr:probable low affinity copper uptake protein 2 [Chanos chanos]